MAELSAEELFRGMTEDEIREAILTTLELSGLRARSWQSGGMLRTLIAAVARVGSMYSKLIVVFNKSNFLDWATGYALTVLARYVYGVERELASFATGAVTLHNVSGGTYIDVPVGDVVFKNPATGKTYYNNEVFTLLPTQTKTVKVRAVELGSASTTAPTTITAFESGGGGVTVTNAASVVGIDEESDPRLRQRCRDKLGILSLMGPRAAYDFIARSAKRADGTPFGITLTKVNLDTATSTGTVALAYSPGEPSGPDVALIADEILKYATPLALSVDVIAATPEEIGITWQAWAHASYGATALEIKAACDAALQQLFYTYPIGGRKKSPGINGYLWKHHVEAAIEKAHPAIFDVSSNFDDYQLDPYGRPKLAGNLGAVTMEST